MREIEPESASQRTKKSKTKPRRLLLYVAVLFGVFALGWFGGSGRVRFTSSVINSTQSSEKIDYSSVEELYKKLSANFDGDLTNQKLVDGLKKGLAEASGDQYTEYLTADEAKEFNQDLNGTFEGIGAELGKEDSYITIIAPIEGYPAQKAGIRSKDKILQINDESAVNLSISEAVKKIRGPKGTEVKLMILRGENDQQEITIKREQIDLPSAKWEVKDGVGILHVSRFDKDTKKLAQQAAEDFEKQGVKKVILDLRGNPGGLLDSAVGLSSLWLENGKTVLEEKKAGKTVQTFTASGQAPFKGLETVVLIDGGSASASEITAGALKDNNVAILIGQKSYGKGSVQQLVELGGGGMLKVTIARWYTPGGKNIDKDGINPDKEIKITEEDIKAQKDPQLEAALTELKN